MYGFIYKIKNKTNNKCYIGQTTQGFNKRYSRRGKGAERVYKYYKTLKQNGYKIVEELYYDMCKYGVENFIVYEKFDIAFSKTELDIKEKIYIQLYGDYNKLSGGTKYEEKDKKTMSKITSGRALSCEHKAKISNSRHGKYCGENSYINKQVRCIETNTIYYSISNAKQITGIDDSCIAKCCKGKRKTAGKFHWEYV